MLCLFCYFISGKSYFCQNEYFCNLLDSIFLHCGGQYRNQRYVFSFQRITLPFSSSKVYCNDRTPWYNYTTQKLHAKPLISALEVGYFYKVSSLSSRNMQYEYILISSFNFNLLPFSFTKIKDFNIFFPTRKTFLYQFES